MTLPAYSRDALVIPVLEELRSCAADQFALAGRLPCRFPITWGASSPPADMCDCTCDNGQGQAWVRWVSTKGASGGTASLTGEDCAGLYEFDIELGVYRCWPVPETRALDEGEEELAAKGLLLDAAVLRRAFDCCDLSTGDEDATWQLNSVQPGARQGGCTSVVAQATVTRADCECGDLDLLPEETHERARELIWRRNL